MRSGLVFASLSPLVKSSQRMAFYSFLIIRLWTIVTSSLVSEELFFLPDPLLDLGVPVVIKCIMKIVSLCRHLMSWPLLYLKIVLFLNQPSVKAVALTHTF